MTGCYRSPKSCLYPRETIPCGAFHSPESHSLWDQPEKRVRLQLHLCSAGSPALSSTTFSGEPSSTNHFPKNPPAQALLQEPQSKKSISHLTAQTAVLLTNSSHVDLYFLIP